MWGTMKRSILWVLVLGALIAACRPASREAVVTAEPLAVAATATQAATATRQVATPRPTATVDPNLTPTWTPVPSDEEGLRALADERDILIGSAVRADELFGDPEYMQTVADEFNLIVVEWELNFLPVNPQPDQYNFSRADPVFDFAEANGLKVHANTLLWYRQVPEWFANGDYSRDEAIEVMRQHITALMSRYKGRAYAWDVVNEAFTDGGELRDSVWLEKIGPEYIEMAFEIAHEVDPDALLFYNDYGAEMPNAKSDAIYEMVADFRARGVPIDGVGFQFHGGLDNRRAPGEIRENFERFGELGLKVYISEMDVGIRKAIGTEQQRLELQADVYEEVLDICLELDYCDMFVVWGVSDQHSWLVKDYPHEQPLLLDENYEPKPAYEAIVGRLQREATER